MLAYWLILAHVFGDYVLQSDWMANEKTKRHIPCLAHTVAYTLSFVFLTQMWQPLLFIAATHFVIDRWRLAKYVVYAKNWLSPPSLDWWHPWEDCQSTGYHKDKPLGLTMWLLIIADNALHALCNGLAFVWWVI